MFPTLWRPYADLRRTETLFDRMWREAISPDGVQSHAWAIPVDIVNDDGKLVVTASLPGVKAGDIDVSIEDDVLTVKAEASTSSEETDDESGYVVRERRHGSFYRAVRLPSAVDNEKIKSRYENGVLTVTLPEAEEPAGRRIEVESA